jgi:hypothetical protein
MRSANSLGKALRKKLSGIYQELENYDIDEIKQDDGLKSNILDDPLFSITINSSNAFTVSAPSEHIRKSLLRDYYYGISRIDKQWKNTITLNNENSTAWALVSAYYCSFFSAIEAIRISGTHLLTLSTAEAEKFFTPQGGPHVQKLISRKNFKGIISKDFSKIGYTTNGEKPHQAAWNQLNKDVLSLISDNDSSLNEINKFKNMCGGKQGWETPSEIRNRWNYRDPMYFSDLGLNSNSPFHKIIADQNEASDWIKSMATIRNEKDSAASIATLTQLLYAALQDSYKYGFSTAYKADKLIFD